jgi:hypothetical protein
MKPIKNRCLAACRIVVPVATLAFSASFVAQQRSAQPPTAPAAQAPRPAAATAPPTAAKAPAAATAKPYVVKKTADGQPDLQGYWTNATYTPMERGANVTKEFFTEEEYAAQLKTRQAGEEEQTTPGTTADVHYDFTQFALDTSQSPIEKNLRTSLIIDPPNGRLPARVGAAAGAGGGRGGAGVAAGGAAGGRGGAAAAAPGAAVPAAGARGGGGGGNSTQYDQVQNMPIGSRCIIMGGAGPPLKDAGYNATYQIVQSPGYVTIITEMIHDVRIIPVDPPGVTRPLPPQQLKQWIGLSRGRWEGNTLVVETTNMNGRNNIQGSSANARITERFTRIAEDKIDYTFTVTDETVWVSPWTASIPMTKERGPMIEFTCHESNYGIANILSGARVSEKEAAGQ